jgi:hypothetical protein
MGMYRTEVLDLGGQGPPDRDPHRSGLLALGYAVDDDVGEHA